jgi:hypothetical protein
VKASLVGRAAEASQEKTRARAALAVSAARVAKAALVRRKAPVVKAVLVVAAVKVRGESADHGGRLANQDMLVARNGSDSSTVKTTAWSRCMVPSFGA